MPWTYQDNPELMIVEVSFTGDVTSHDLRESTTKLIQLEKERGPIHFLVDTSEMKYVATILDIYDLPKQYLEEGANKLSNLAVILSTSKKEKETAEFYETVCRNRGWNVRVFAQRQAAIDWLTDSADSDESEGDDE